MQTVFDRAGNQYQVAEDEAAAILATGAYFADLNTCGSIQMKSAGTLVTIYEVKTGKAIERRSVDATELVASGHYSYSDPRQAPQAAPQKQQEPQEPRESQDPHKQQEQGKQESQHGDDHPLPVLTAENNKAEILAALGQYGIQYRANMDKADLLALWENFVAEQTKA